MRGIADHVELVLDDGLEADELVGVGRHQRRLAQHQHGGFQRAGIERLVFGGDADAGFAQLGPELVPFDGIGLVEAELAVGGIERLAALAQPVVERRLGIGAVGDRLHAAADIGGIEGLAHGHQVVIGPGIGRARRCRLPRRRRC